MVGAGAGIFDPEYIAAGAEIVTNADQIYQRAKLIVKVKEPLASERKQLRRGQIIFTYLHLAPDPEQTRDLMDFGVTALAYETVTDAAGTLPLLAPMSEVAGCMAPQVAAHFLQRPQGGRGILLGRIEGVPSAEVAVLGGGVVGSNAAEMAIGMGANVTVAARSKETGAACRSVLASASVCHGRCRGHRSPLPLRRRGHRSRFGCGRSCAKAHFGADCRGHEARLRHRRRLHRSGRLRRNLPPDHASQPTFVVDGVVHYCVANMPGAVPRTSTFALDNATRPFVLALADKGFPQALIDDTHLQHGLNVHDGKITCRAVADALRLPYTQAAEVLR